MKTVSTSINLNGPLVTLINVAPVEEVVAVPVSQAMRAQRYEAPQLRCLCRSYGENNDPKSKKLATATTGRHRRRRNVLDQLGRPPATTVGHGRRNAFAFANCFCRNSWLEGLLNVIPPLPLPQQLALGTPQRRTRQEVRDRPSRTQSTPYKASEMYTTCRRDRKAMVGSRGRHSRSPSFVAPGDQRPPTI